MKKLLFLLLFPMLLYGQGVTQLAERTLYRGNPDDSFKLLITKADSGLVASVVLYTDKGGRPLVSTLQPTLIRSGRMLTIAWSKAQTTALPDKPWLEISAGDVVRFQLWINVNKNPLSTTAPGSQTVVSPVVVTAVPELTYPIQNLTNTGQTITHGKGTRLVTGTFFREDTGQVDPLIKTEVINDNSIIVRGPPGEINAGRLILKFTFILSN